MDTRFNILIVEARNHETALRSTRPSPDAAAALALTRSRARSRRRLQRRRFLRLAHAQGANQSQQTTDGSRAAIQPSNTPTQELSK